MTTTTSSEHKPDPIYYLEKIGDTDYKLTVEKLDVLDDIVLWDNNPRLVPFADGTAIHSEEELEAKLQRTPGYDGLKRSLEDVGQLDPIYVWGNSEMKKKRVLEGATRATILRSLARLHPNDPKFRTVKAKVLPPEFPEEHVIVLLARIHVRGSGVRSWGRYVEAKFIFENTESMGGRKPVTTVGNLGRWLGKSPSWISRLRDAYKFAQQYVEHQDGDDAKHLAFKEFSTLEEISKCAGFGPKLKAEAEEAVKLREEVFDMVTHGVFTEYRDARFMKEFYDDPEKWAQLKTHEKGIAHKLATELKVGNTSVKAKIGSLYAQIDRAIKANAQSLDLSDLEELERCQGLLGSHVASGVGAFRIRLQSFLRSVREASLKDLIPITDDELNNLKAGIEDIEYRREKIVSSRTTDG